MARFFQYQAKTEAPFGARPESYPNRWHQPWSMPVRQRIVPALAIALSASGLFANPFTPPAVAAPTVSTVTSDIIFPRSFIYQSHTEPVLPQPTIVIVPDSITVSVSSPVIYQNKFIYQAYAKPVLPPAAAGTINEWYEPWSEPLRSKVLPTAQRVRAWIGPTAPPAAPVTADEWHRPWSEPTRTRKFNTALQDVGAPDVTLPPPVLLSQWYEPWTDPVRQRGISVALHQSLIWSNFTPSAVSDIRWIYQWSEPTRRKPVTPDIVSQPLLPPPVLVSQWYEPWAEPVRQKPGLATNLQQSLAWSTFTPAVVTATFVESFSSDVIYSRSFIYQSHIEPIQPPAAPTVPTYFNLTQGDTGLVFQKTLIYQVNTDPIGVTAPFVYAPWVDPVRRKGPHVSLLPSFAWSNFTPPAVVTTDVRWIYPWSEPVRTRKFGPHLQDVGAPDVVNPPPVLVSQWYEPWVDPTRRIGLAVALQQEPAWSNFTPPAVVTADIRWIYPWSEPVRTRILPVAVATSGPIQTIQPPTILVSQWYESWIDPVKLKPGLSVALHQSLIWSNFTPPFTDNRWLSSWSEPVRQKPGLLASLQQTLAWSNFTPTPTAVTDIKWSYGWSEPVRVRRFPTSQQQPLAFVALLKNASNIAAPYYPWSEPVRIKQGLKTHLQSFTSLVTPPQPNFIRTINWYQAWSEPVRQKKGIKVQYQSAFVLGTPIIKTQVTLTMSAFEINTDMFLAGLFTGNPAVNANVSIKEIPAIKGAAVSLEET